MIWIVLIIGVAVVAVIALRGIEQRNVEQDHSAVVEATIDRSGVLKRRNDGLTEAVGWAEIHTIVVLHRVTDQKAATDVVSGFVIGRQMPVNEPTLLVFHASDDGAVLPAWPEVVEALLIHMRHHCAMGSAQLNEVRQRIELRERGNYVLWTRVTD